MDSHHWKNIVYYWEIFVNFGKSDMKLISLISPKNVDSKIKQREVLKLFFFFKDYDLLQLNTLLSKV